ncbi:MAG: ABC transporter permease [Chloroflexota bacterium]|nr:MAG: ABC transporter permease [Chloroflexota bacterium]
MTESLEQSSYLSLTTDKLDRVKTKLHQLLQLLGPLLLGIVIGLLIGAVLIMMAGADPITAYRAMFNGAFGGKRQLTETILKTVPLLIIGLGLAVAFRGRVWNIGAEGQYFIGALFGSVIALQFSTLPATVLIPAILVAGMIGGALWGLIPALLRTRRGMSEIITTLMLNYVAIFIVEYMGRAPLKDPNGFLPESAQFVKAARLSYLFGTRLHLGVLIALALVPLIYVLIWHTPMGFRLRAIGSKESVARFAGVKVEWTIIYVLLLSGALAGLAGIMEVSYLHTRLKGAISGGYGFTAILVALLGRMHPAGVLFAAIFFSALSIGANSMHTLTGLPRSLADAIQSLVVLFVLGFDAYFRLRRS